MSVVQGMPVVTPFNNRPTRLDQQFSIALTISLAHINSKPVLILLWDTVHSGH